ncbi:hypothetical protein BGZ98_010182 [Dissophora globulifera]|nr:hypothetical protein BGZ98_010182 [Dissophora globulifera]
MRRLTVLSLFACLIMAVTASPLAKREEAANVKVVEPTDNEVDAVGAFPLDFGVENNDGWKDKDHRNRCTEREICKGVVPVDSEKYLCRDKRLGPKKLPTRFPLDDITHPYNRFGGICSAAKFLSLWTDNNGAYVYPPKDGFQLNTNDDPIKGTIKLRYGTLLDRFGSEYGQYLSPAEAPYPQRALPPSNLDTPTTGERYPYNYHVYKVIKDLEVVAGPIAPWFGQPGQGTQYFVSTNIFDLISRGYLKPLPLEFSKIF